MTSSPLEFATPNPAVLGQLVAERFASRLTGGDSTLWGPAAQEEASIRLGWVGLHETSRPLLAEVEAVQADLRAEGLDHVVLCGMGGSSLAPEVITGTAGVELTVLDTTDPGAIARALSDRLDRTVVVVSSKSGTTVETDSQRRAFEAAFRGAGIEPGPRMVAVTDAGSALGMHATEAGYRRVFLADKTVGGRYSALSAFGLVPSGLAGADIAALLDDAASIAPLLASDSDDNPGLRLGVALASGVHDKVAIEADGSGIVGFPDWAEQLIAESTGKEGTGVLPIAVRARDPEVTTPPPDTTVVRLTAGPLGAQFLIWEYATAVAGRILGINPFDQPDVESAKKAARGFLDAQPEAEPAAFVDGSIEARATPGLLAGADSLASAVDALLARLGERDYLAVMAYLDREGDDAALASVRPALTRRTGRPVTFGWGPRFLHSTGQYHKGGPATGVFLQVTGAVSDDVAVPDRPFTFGQLITAQAAGDAQVLADHDRPVLRLHLTDRAAGLAQLMAAFA